MDAGLFHIWDILSGTVHGILMPSTLRRETKKIKDTSTSLWFALSCNALGRDAVEAKDGYMILYSPAPFSTKDNHHEYTTIEQINAGPSKLNDQLDFVCWEFVGSSICL